MLKILKHLLFRDTTTAFHKPGLYAPASPPKPSERQKSNNYVLLPVEQNYQHTIIEPQEKKTEEPLLAAHNEEVSPLLEPPPNHPHQLLPYNPIKYPRSSDDEFNEENLQYLSPQVRDMIRMAKNPDDERLIDVWDGLRANPLEVSSRGKLSTSNLRLLLLYDLLSRDAKRQRLSDYSVSKINLKYSISFPLKALLDAFNIVVLRFNHGSVLSMIIFYRRFH